MFKKSKKFPLALIISIFTLFTLPPLLVTISNSNKINTIKKLNTIKSQVTISKQLNTQLKLSFTKLAQSTKKPNTDLSGIYNTIEDTTNQLSSLKPLKTNSSTSQYSNQYNLILAQNQSLLNTLLEISQDYRQITSQVAPFTNYNAADALSALDPTTDTEQIIENASVLSGSLKTLQTQLKDNQQAVLPASHAISTLELVASEPKINYQQNINILRSDLESLKTALINTQNQYFLQNRVLDSLIQLSDIINQYQSLILAIEGSLKQCSN